MIVNVKIEFSLKNGLVKTVEVEEINPKGVLKDNETKEERTVNLTANDIAREYAKKITNGMDKGETLYFRGSDSTVLMVNPNEISSVEVSTATIHEVDEVVEVGGSGR